DTEHDAEGEEDGLYRRPLRRGHAGKAWEQAVPAVGEDQRGTMRDRNRETIDAGLLVRPGEDVEVARLGAVPMCLHGRDLDRLMRKRVEAVLVADEQLQRRQDRHQTD